MTTDHDETIDAAKVKRFLRTFNKKEYIFYVVVGMAFMLLVIIYIQSKNYQYLY